MEIIKEGTKRMNLESKLKNQKVAGKLNFYRTCMIGLMVLMGIASIALCILMYSKVNDITNVWSPSLSCVQELDGLTSDYRLKQYGHLVAMDDATMASYEEEMAYVDEQITSVSASFQKMITTEKETEIYHDIQEKWASYKEQSEEIIALSRAGKTEEAGLMMVEEVYDTFKDFNASFDELLEYENGELSAAKDVVRNVFIIMIVIIIVVVLAAALVATSIGTTISKMITGPIAQLEEAIVHMREGDFSKTDLLTYDSEDELGVVTKKLSETLVNLTAYVEEISEELRKIAKGDLTRNGEDITNFLGEFSSIKESLLYILKRFNSTLTEIQGSSEYVAADAEEIAKASQALSDGASDQASAVEELTAMVATVSNLAEDSAKATHSAYEQIQTSADKAELEKQKMHELTEEMQHISEISKEIEDIITAIEDIASQTNLLSLNASIEAARAGEAGKGFAVVADQIGKLASDSAQSAVNTRELINKTLIEIEKGNSIAVSTSEAFEQIIVDMKASAELAHQTTENANTQAGALVQVEQGIEQISGAVQNIAASSEENTAISANLSEKSEQLDELVKRFKLF